MNILFSSDDNYARHMGVAIYSLLAHNQDVEKIDIYVVDNHICDDNIQKVREVADGFSNAELHFIPFDDIARQLQLDMPWKISLSSYARLFVGQLLPTHVDRVLYLDCDIIVNENLDLLWNMSLEGKCLGAIQDQVTPNIRKSVGLNADSSYFNAGVLLIDLRRWRELNIDQQCVDFINAHRGRVIHHDQGVVNGIFREHWFRLPLRYNVMTIHYLMNQEQCVKYFHDLTPFYCKEEIDAAKFNPALIHFTPSFTSRPWQKNCRHPLKSLYNILLQRTPWKGHSCQEEDAPWYLKLISWRYRNFPII